MQSVFYADSGGIIASHARLVEMALGGKVHRSRLVFGYGYPGNLTPYPRTKILTPNTSYSMVDNLVRRFWPIITPSPKTSTDLAGEVLVATSTALKNMSVKYPVKMALTAGLDSRVMLGIGLHAGIDFETYTYGVNRATALDRSFAPDLAQKVGVPHTLVPRVDAPNGLPTALKEAHYSPSHVGAVPGLIQYFGDKNTVGVTGNLLEIGQSFYKQYQDKGMGKPVDSASMAALHFDSLPPKSQERIARHGLDRYFGRAHKAFDSFIADTSYDKTVGLLDPFDQFYWEHRMATWHGALLLERDFYGIPFIPFNSRRIFESMLGLPQAERDEATLFYRMLDLMDTRLTELPINPKRWP